MLQESLKTLHVVHHIDLDALVTLIHEVKVCDLTEGSMYCITHTHTHRSPCCLVLAVKSC